MTTFTTENRFKEYDNLADHYGSGRSVGPGTYTTSHARAKKIKGASAYHQLMNVDNTSNTSEYGFYGYRLMKALKRSISIKTRNSFRKSNKMVKRVKRKVKGDNEMVLVQSKLYLFDLFLS